MLVVGGGMSGAMIANELVHAGHQVTVVDANVPGLASSDGNTCIVQYCSDMSLHEMIGKWGERHAVDFYRFSLDVTVTHRWQSVFGESNDGLPFIGQDKDDPDLYFAFGFGGNGTCYCAMASVMMRDFLKGTPHPLSYTTAYPRAKKQSADGYLQSAV